MVFVFLIVSLVFLHLVAGEEICDQMQGYSPILKISSLGPAEAPDHISLLRTMHLYWLWIVHLYIIVVLLAFYSIYVHRYNKLLKQEISERRNMEHKLQHYAAELKHSNEMKDLFADIMRHDLINPAVIINSYAEILLEMETDAKKFQYLKSLYSSNQKLMELIEDAASFTKLDSIDSIYLERMDLSFIITNVVESMRLQISEKNALVSFSPSGPFIANINPLVEQVFVNFLSNALKYGPQNGRIDIEITDAGDSWKVCFADEGEGIPEEFKEAIFERFKRLERGAIKGSGLGLAIAKRIVELHNGELGVTDNPIIKGSIFWATFPKA
jgi:signal transduction histidine kinase